MGIGVTGARFCAFANFSRNEQASRMPTAWSDEMTKCQNSLADALTSKIHVTLHVRAVSQSLCGIPPALTKSSYAPSETGSVLSDEDDQKHAAIAAGGLVRLSILLSGILSFRHFVRRRPFGLASCLHRIPSSVILSFRQTATPDRFIYAESIIQRHRTQRGLRSQLCQGDHDVACKAALAAYSLAERVHGPAWS